MLVDNVIALCCSKVYIGDSCITYLALDRLMNVPEDVCLYDIQTTFPGFGYEVRPHLLNFILHEFVEFEGGLKL
jgi:hypothetical protein